VTLRTAAIQHDIVWEDPTANMAHLRPKIEQAATDGARLIVISEMWSTGFTMNAVEMAEASAGPTPTFMREMAESTGAWIAGSFPERTDGYERPTNRLLIAGPGGEDHRYSKVHPFSYSGEDQHYSAGRDHITIEIEGVRITPTICFDLRFADQYWNAAAETDCYLVPANWPATRSTHWTSLLRARAIENQAYVVGVNRVGSGNGLDYCGDTRIVDPVGEITEATPGVEMTIMADIDPNVVADTRARFPFMLDR
jgi:predicted amidohydrolase